MKQGAVYFSPVGENQIFHIEGIWTNERPEGDSFYTLASFNSSRTQYLQGSIQTCHLSTSRPHGFTLHTNHENETNYTPLVQLAIREMSRPQADLKKVVLSRCKAFELDDWDAMAAFLLIQQTYPHAFVSLIIMPDEEWIFASPELLLSQQGSSIKTMSLAGTRSLDSKHAFGEKEFEEQDIVSRYLLEKLAMAGVENIATRGPYEREAGNLKHLCTEISGSIQKADALNLAILLHPSPAVGGAPQEQALSFIAQHETYDREFYAGYQGWLGTEESWYYVNLRCLKRSGNTIFLYSGAGITAQSEAEKEWEETNNKMQTLLTVLGSEPMIL